MVKVIIQIQHYVRMLTLKFNFSQKNWCWIDTLQTLQMYTLESSLVGLVVKPLEPTSVSLGSNPTENEFQVQFDFVGGLESTHM